jgi:Ca-activated chloride channel homolog
MPFLAPLALAGLAFVPLVVAFYLLKLRRDERVVPSTLLWQRLLTDVEANAPWQRLRRSLLLLLQLLLVLILALLAARPFLERPAGFARDLVIVMDASASMAATDVVPSRMTEARARAIDALRDLPAGGHVSVIAAGRTARVVANATSDLGHVRSAIESISPEAAPGDMADALRLASALAARAGDAEVLVVTDGAISPSPTVRVDAPVRTITVGRQRHNQAIVALAVRTAPSAVTRSVFVSVANLDVEKVERRLELYGDGRLLEARDVYLDPVARADVSIDDLPRDVGVVEVRLTDEDGAPADQLATDDRAWAVVPSDRLRRILLVGAGDPYLESALTHLPGTELYGLTLDKFGSDTHPEKFDLIIFEGALPDPLPARPILAIAPTKTSPLGTVTGTLTRPGIGTLNPDEPILHFVDLSTVHIADAAQMTLPDWARTVIPGPGKAPLLYSGDRAGLATAVMTFDPRHSDLPLQVAFPIMLSNLAGELMGGGAGPAGAVVPGTAVELAIPSGATGVHVVGPDGAALDLAAGTADAQSVTFASTQELGVYTVTGIGAATASPGPSGSAGAAASAVTTPSASASSPSGSPGASPGPSGSAPPGAGAVVRFAVDLFDVDESTITPGSGAGLEALGAVAGAAPGGTDPAVTRPPARDELWTPLLIVVLLLLCIEWAVYERDSLSRGRRALVARFGRGDGAKTKTTRPGSGRSSRPER